MSKNGGGKLSFPDPSRFLPPDPAFLPCEECDVLSREELLTLDASDKILCASCLEEERKKRGRRENE